MELSPDGKSILFVREGQIRRVAVDPASPIMPQTWKSRAVSAADVVSVVQSGARVFIHGACATPAPLIEALCARRDLADVRLYHLHTAGAAPFAAPGRENEFRSISLFTGAPLRQAVAEDRADFVPIFLSDIPGLFLSGRVKLDVAFLQLSPPDSHGLCSLGTSCDAAKAAADTARLVVAEINEQMPRTHGNNVVPLARVAHRQDIVREPRRLVPGRRQRHVVADQALVA